MSDSSAMRLTGIWKLALDPGNVGRTEHWFEAQRPEAQDVPVPGIIQQVFPAYHGVAWYWRTFPGDLASDVDHKLLLHFDDVDYFGEVWLNGQLIGSHEGSETPFDVDATPAYRAGAENMLAVRVINVTSERIDGLLLSEIPHRNRVVPFTNGSSLNQGGVMWNVELRRVPVVYVANAFAMPNIHTGSFAVRVILRNDTDQTIKATLSAAIGSATADIATAEVSWCKELELVPGDTQHEFTLRLLQPRLWEPDDPFLYRLTVNLATIAHVGAASSAPTGTSLQHSYSLRCGLRELRVERGFFRLNGRRIYLRSMHTGNGYPLGQHIPMVIDQLRRDLLHTKEAGFNCLRFISGVAWPEQLDFCDEIGLMVYEECQASWCLGNSPRMGEYFDQATGDMILRDRNHPCVVAWGLLNETVDGPVFRQAVAFLPKLRALDPTRLAFLDSGRWDCQRNIGSISNPGGQEWEHTWSIEGPDATPAPARWDLGYAGGYFELAGDAHAYPVVPQSDKDDQFIRTLGQGSKPVFFSEYGIGSLMNVVRELRWCEQVRAQREAAGLPVPQGNYEEVDYLHTPADKLAADWQRLGFEGVYPVLEDMLRDSQRLHVRQRLLGFDLIRSNPQICGHSLTSATDCLVGEGVWSLWREWKPGVVDALIDGWAALRWCLFVNPQHAYAGRPFTIEAVLANEDVLPPGEYPVTVRISRKAEGIYNAEGAAPGVVWEKHVTLTIPQLAAGEDGPLAIPVLKEEVTLPGPSGAFELRAYMDRGGAPAGGRLAFRLTDAADLPTLKATVLQWGLEPRVQDWLAKHGVICQPYSTRLRSTKPSVILVGQPPEAERNQAHWSKLIKLMAQGSVVVFLSPAAFKRGEDAVAWLPLANKGKCFEYFDWLYHKECVAKAHPAFAGLQAGGIMDWDFYGQVIPHVIFEGQDTPDETVAAAFAVCCWPTPYVCGTLLGAYKLGAGQMVLNTIRILEQLDQHPAADRLLLNIVADAIKRMQAPAAEPAREAEVAEVLKSLGKA